MLKRSLFGSLILFSVSIMTDSDNRNEQVILILLNYHGNKIRPCAKQVCVWNHLTSWKNTNDYNNFLKKDTMQHQNPTASSPSLCTPGLIHPDYNHTFTVWVGGVVLTCAGQCLGKWCRFSPAARWRCRCCSAANCPTQQSSPSPVSSGDHRPWVHLSMTHLGGGASDGREGVTFVPQEISQDIKLIKMLKFWFLFILVKNSDDIQEIIRIYF